MFCNQIIINWYKLTSMHFRYVNDNSKSHSLNVLSWLIFLLLKRPWWHWTAHLMHKNKLVELCQACQAAKVKVTTYECPIIVHSLKQMPLIIVLILRHGLICQKTKTDEHHYNTLISICILPKNPVYLTTCTRFFINIFKSWKSLFR